MEQDFLDEMIEESTRRNPEFPSLMKEALQRRALLIVIERSFPGRKHLEEEVSDGEACTE